MKSKSIGIIGLGSFGTFVASLIPSTTTIYGFDNKHTTSSNNIQLTDIATVASADIVILAIPLSEYETMLPKLKPLLPDSTLLIDVCSVKVLPERLFAKHLSSHKNILMTHPLFGPQSANNGLEGHKLVVTNAAGAMAHDVVNYCKNDLHLTVSELSAKEHDKIMANVHALTFFLARGLSDMHIEKGPFTTPSYQMIMDLVTFNETHSNELFETIQSGNPYAEHTRHALLEKLQLVEARLSLVTDEQAQPHIRSLNPYQPGMPTEALARLHDIPVGKIVKLASNENPLGMSPRALEALNDKTTLHEAARYPAGFQLTKALSDLHHVDPQQVILGNGSNDVLDLVARVFLGAGSEAISSEYAFSVYPLVTTMTGASNIVVPATDFGHDLEAMKHAITDHTRVIWIANPNNPTGTFIPYPQLKTFLETIPKHIIVVLDEAYFEYLPSKLQTNSVAWLTGFSNLIITRTFSKIYGMAGMRVGYGLASPEIIELLNRVRQPFNVSSLGLAAAVAALGDSSFVADSMTANQKGMKQLVAAMKARNISFIPSFGNFLSIKVPNAQQINEQLLTRGIIVRPLASQGMADYLRVTVGTTLENAQFIQALTELLG